MHQKYSREEIQKMLEHCTDVLDKLIILMFSSAGFRLEAWDYFCWKDVIFFQNEEDGQYKGAALRVYRGDPEEYWTFVTPETCNADETYAAMPQTDDTMTDATTYKVCVRMTDSAGNIGPDIMISSDDDCETFSFTFILRH